MVPFAYLIQTGLLFTILTTVFFLFPPELPVTGSNMNYAIAVFGFICKSIIAPPPPPPRRTSLTVSHRLDPDLDHRWS